jgi:hypothetical protein
MLKAGHRYLEFPKSLSSAEPLIAALMKRSTVKAAMGHGRLSRLDWHHDRSTPDSRRVAALPKAADLGHKPPWQLSSSATDFYVSSVMRRLMIIGALRTLVTAGRTRVTDTWDLCSCSLRKRLQIHALSPRAFCRHVVDACGSDRSVRRNTDRLPPWPRPPTCSRCCG